MNLFAVGKIVGVFGVRGYVKVQPTTHSRERFSRLHRVFVGRSEHESIESIVEDVILDRRSIAVKLSSTGDRTEAERMVGQFLFVEEADLARPVGRSYFIHDIVGCEVWSTAGQLIGTVADVYKMSAQDLWVVRQDEKEYLIPAVKEFVDHVDLKNRKIVINVIDGLLEQ